MGMPWIKLHQDTVSDPKFARLPELVQWRYVRMSLIAGQSDAEGYLISKTGDPFTVGDMAFDIRVDAASMQESVTTLIGAGFMGQEDDGLLFIVNFSDDQGRPQSEKRKMWRERKRRQREQEQDGQDEGDESSKNCPQDVTRDTKNCLASRIEERRADEEEMRLEGDKSESREDNTPPCGANLSDSQSADDATWLAESRIVAIDSGDEQEPPEEQPPPADYLEAVVQHVESVAKGKKDWTRHPDAGGADDWANGPVDAFCKRAGLGGQVLPDKKRGQWAKALREVGQEWEAGPGDVATAIEAMLDDEHLTAWKSYSSPYQQGFKDDLGATIGALRMEKAGLKRPKNVIVIRGV